MPLWGVWTFLWDTGEPVGRQQTTHHHPFHSLWVSPAEGGGGSEGATPRLGEQAVTRCWWWSRQGGVDMKGRGASEADSKRQIWKASHRPRPAPVIGWKTEGRLMGFLGCMMSREIEGASFPGSWSSPQCLSQRSPCMYPKENLQGISLQNCL